MVFGIYLNLTIYVFIYKFISCKYRQDLTEMRRVKSGAMDKENPYIYTRL